MMTTQQEGILQKINYGKIFMLGFDSFGFSLVWMVYNTFVLLFLEGKFGLVPAFIGFFYDAR